MKSIVALLLMFTFAAQAAYVTNSTQSLTFSVPLGTPCTETPIYSSGGVDYRGVTVNGFSAPFTCELVVAPPPPPPAGTPSAICPADVATMAAGTWCEVLNSNMSAVYFQWPAGVQFSSNGLGTEQVMAAWSGGAFDSLRNRLLIWGGGHAAYAGNELYAFNVGSLSWNRVTDPSIPIAYNSAYAADGRPGARHTYNNLAYLPGVDKFCSFGSGSDYPSGNDIGAGMTVCFNSLNQWENRAPSTFLDVVLGTKAAHDPVTGKAFVQIGNKGPFASYDYASNAWQVLESFTGWINYESGMVIDPISRKALIFGAGQQWYFNLTNSTRTTNSTTGGAAVIGVNGPGIQYHPGSHSVIAWVGGKSVWKLNLTTNAWTQLYNTSSISVPTAPEARGTYGRFAYVPSKDVFILVNRTTDPVFFYKLP